MKHKCVLIILIRSQIAIVPNNNKMKSYSAAALSLVFALTQSESVSADNVSVYHLRRQEKFVLSCLREDIDITVFDTAYGTHIISYMSVIVILFP